MMAINFGMEVTLVISVMYNFLGFCAMLPAIKIHFYLYIVINNNRDDFCY